VHREIPLDDLGHEVAVLGGGGRRSAVEVAPAVVARQEAVAPRRLGHVPFGAEQQPRGGQQVERRRQVVLQHVADVHLRPAEQPLVLGVVGDALERVRHGGNEHVHHDHHHEHLEHGEQPVAHQLRELVRLRLGVRVAGGRGSVAHHHVGRVQRRHAEYAPEQRLERVGHRDERVLLSGGLARLRVLVHHARVIRVIRAQAARERRHDDHQERGELAEVVQHLAEGHLHGPHVVVELAQEQQPQVRHHGGHGEQALGQQLRVGPVPVLPVQVVVRLAAGPDAGHRPAQERHDEQRQLDRVEHVPQVLEEPARALLQPQLRLLHHVAQHEHHDRQPRPQFRRAPARLELVRVRVREQQPEEHQVGDQAVEHPVDRQPVELVQLRVGRQHSQRHRDRQHAEPPQQVRQLPLPRVRLPLDPVAQPRGFQHLLDVDVRYELLLLVVHGCDQSRVRELTSELATVPISQHDLDFVRRPAVHYHFHSELSNLKSKTIIRCLNITRVSSR